MVLRTSSIRLELLFKTRALFFKSRRKNDCLSALLILSSPPGERTQIRLVLISLSTESRMSSVLTKVPSCRESFSFEFQLKT